MQSLSILDEVDVPTKSAKRASPFDLQNKVVLITGGAGLLGEQHARAVLEAKGTPILADISAENASRIATELSSEYGRSAQALALDVTQRASCEAALSSIVTRYGRLDVLVNNAAMNPKVEGAGLGASRFENFAIERWSEELAVGLTGAFLASQVFGGYMAERGGGVIVNIASDLALIAPDQRIYRQAGLEESEQPVKPVTYSVIKGALVNLTKYLATYWASQQVRVNALSPGGVYDGQPEAFVERLTHLIPLGRMARRDEYRSALVFLCSDASSYMTGTNLVIDGGRTCW